MAGLGVVRANHGGFCNSRMRNKCAFNFGSRDAVTRDIHYVINTTKQPEIPICIELGAVTCEVAALVLRPIRFLVALRIVPNTAQHAGPRMCECEITATMFNRFSGLIHHFSVNSRERESGRSGLGRGCTREWADHDAAGFGLPPCVHDRTVTATDVLVVPNPRFGVYRFADRAKKSQRREVMFCGLLNSPFHVGADRCGCRVED